MLLLLCWANPAAADILQSPVDANASTRLALGRHLMVLVDETNQLGFDEVSRSPQSGRFEPVFVDTPFYGRTKATYWFRLQLAFNQPGEPRLIEIAYPHLRQITLFQQTGDAPPQVTESGYANGMNSHNSCLRFCFLIKGEQGIHTLYFRVQTDSPLFLPIILRSPENQLLSERISMGGISFFYGAFIVMALFNLFVHFSTGERSYLLYVFYIGSLVLWATSHDGLLRELVLRHHSVLASYSTHFLLTLLTVICGALFCQSFLKTQETMPRHHYLFSFLILLALIDMGLILTFGRILFPSSVNLLSMALSATGVSASILGWSKGLKTARFFLTAWISVIIGTLAWVLTIAGILPFNNVTALSVHIGALLESVLLSLALGDRINMLQAERIKIKQEANRKLEESNQNLEISNRFKDDFLSTISHELRTPMNGIVGATELLENTSLDLEQFRYLSTLHRSSHDMLAMVEDILSYTQFEAGTVRLHAEPSSLRRLLDEIITRYRGRAAVQQLDFRHHVDPAIPDDLLIDRDKLKLLLEHLLDNATKFTDQGSIRFEVTLDAGHPDTSALWLRFVIKDTGCGVPESLQKAIFDSFRQADSSMTRRKGGLGIGLALCKRIVNILQGQINFKSAVNHGTTVSVTLPFQPSNVRVTAMPEQILPDIQPASTDILVVEDNYVNKLVMEGFLKKLGFNVFAAENGKEAVSMLERRAFNLVLMDCQMPVMDGFEASRLIRQLNNSNATVPIIAVTANANPGDRERCLAAGMNDYMKKPFSQVMLVRMINQWLGRSAWPATVE